MMSHEAQLRSNGRRAGCARHGGGHGPPYGFTLIEMLVSLAVLVLALSIVSVVFTTTTRTASQSAAYSEMHNYVRQFMEQIEEDLRYVDPSSSVLVIVGRKQPAALTQPQLDAGQYYRVQIGNKNLGVAGYDPASATREQFPFSDPRADIIMFVTNRPTVSQGPPIDPITGAQYSYDEAARDGIPFGQQIVTYGHAALIDAKWNGTNYELPSDAFGSADIRHIETPKSGNDRRSILPANRWHLSRHSAIPRPPQTGEPLNKLRLVGDEPRRVVTCVPTTDTKAADVIPFNTALFFAGLNPNPNMLPANQPALQTPYSLQAWNNITPPGWDGSISQVLKSLMYRSGSEMPAHHVATVLTEVPVELRSNLGVQMLPGCAWFQVEFLMPEDPRNSISYADPNEPNLPQPPQRRCDTPLWTSIEPNASRDLNTYVFIPDTQANRQQIASQLQINPTTRQPVPIPDSRLESFARLDQNPARDNPPAGAPNTVLSNRVLRTWPYAIRITVHVYDSRGRLDKPIIRSIVHRFE